MSGTCLTDLKAISLTANAKATAYAKGTDLNGLVVQAERLTGELTVILKQIVALHPTTGGDATNSASLTAIIAELA